MTNPAILDAFEASGTRAKVVNLGAPEWFDWKVTDEEMAEQYLRVWADRLEKLKGMREHPGKWPALFDYYAESPQGLIAFVNHWGTTYDPRNAGTKRPTAMPFVLFQRQAEFLDWLWRRWKGREDGLVEKSRDMGISWCCVAFAVWLWRFHPGSVTGFGSYKEEYVDKSDEPKSLFWKVRYFIDRLPTELKAPGYDRENDAPHMIVKNRRANATIFGETGDNIGRGARASIYFKDESAHYTRAASIDAALSQTSNCQIDVSTPAGEGNEFWKKAVGGVVAKFVFDWRDDPRKGPKWYEEQKRRMTPVALAQEVDRDYSAAVSDSFIDGQTVTLAAARGPMDVRPTGPLMVGVDVARFGDDKTVVTFRRGRVLLKQVRWGHADLQSTAGRVRRECEAFRELPAQVAVDTIGIGAGVADTLRTFPGWREIVEDVNSSVRLADGSNYNLRSYCWTQMRDWLDTASIPNGSDLRMALTSLKYSYRGGELLMESKEDAKKRLGRSPDEADSLALTFARPPKLKKPDPPPGSAPDYAPDDETGM